MQPALFPDWQPEPSAVPSPKGRAKVSGEITYKPYRLRGRTLCQDCTAVIHELGMEKAPYPRSVRWKRCEWHDNGTETVTLLCDPHRLDRLEAEK